MIIKPSIQRTALFPHDFSQVSSRGLYLSSHCYCFYRLIMLLIITSLFTLLLLYGPEARNWAYLTYWGFTATLLYFFLAVVESMMLRVLDNRHPFVKDLWKLLHILFQNLLCVELMINGVFWIAFFPFIMYYRSKSKTPLGTLDILQAVGAHVIPLLLLLIDMFNNLICFWNKRSRKYTVITLLTYLAFNMAYTFIQGPIYPILTYNDLLTYVFVACNVIGTLIVYQIVFVLSYLYKNKRVLEILKKSNKQKEVMQEVERDLTQIESKKSENILLIRDQTDLRNGRDHFQEL